MDFTIVRKENNGDSFKMIEFQAVDKNGKEIFGASATLSQIKDIFTMKWQGWKINFGSAGAGSYEDRLPQVTAINEAMEELGRKK